MRRGRGVGLIAATALFLGACATPPAEIPVDAPVDTPAPEITAAKARDLAARELARGQPTAALIWAQKAAQLDPADGDVRTIEGAALMQLGRHEDAYAAFTEAVALLPEDPSVHLNRARAAMALMRPAEAEADFTEAIRLAPDRRAAWEGRAGARLALGDAEGVDADLQAALRLDAARARQAQIDRDAADVQARIAAR